MSYEVSSVMMLFIIGLAETANETDYDETLLPIAIALGVIALAYAAIAAWIVTQKIDH